MIKLYGFELSFPVNRVRLCLNAMGLEYELIRINPLAGDTQTEDYRKINPVGKIPAIVDDGFTLFESNAIMKYLCRKYNSEFYPDDIKTQADIDKWLDFTAIHLGNGFGKVLFNKFLAGFVGAEVDEQSLKDGYVFIERFMGSVDRQLATSKFLASDKMTIADFCLLATVDPAEAIEINISDYPNIDAWRQKLLQESFYTDMHKSFIDTFEKFKPLLEQN
jgi:glutathione S-transferase